MLERVCEYARACTLEILFLDHVRLVAEWCTRVCAFHFMQRLLFFQLARLLARHSIFHTSVQTAFPNTITCVILPVAETMHCMERVVQSVPFTHFSVSSAFPTEDNFFSFFFFLGEVGKKSVPLSGLLSHENGPSWCTVITEFGPRRNRKSHQDEAKRISLILSKLPRKAPSL